MRLQLRDADGLEHEHLLADGELQHEQIVDGYAEPERAAVHPRQLARASRTREVCSERVSVTDFLPATHPS